MDTERLYRHSMPGIFFLGSLFLFYLLKGGDPTYVWNILKKENYLFFIAVLITSPILGVVISTIGLKFLNFFIGNRIYVNNPPDRIKWIVLRRDDPLMLLPEKVKFEPKKLKEYFCKHQAYIRAELDTETFRFLERRWNFFWIHLGNVSAIFLSFILSFFLDYDGKNNSIKQSLLISIALGLLLYFVFAMWRMISLRNEVVRIEEEAIIKKYYTR